MAEDRKTLDVLGTRGCRVVEAAKKYSLNALESRICRMLSGPQILEAEPLRCFAIARQGRLTEEMRLAAKYTLSLHSFLSADLLALVTSHHKCGDTVYTYKLKTDISRIKSHYGTKEACTMFSGTSSSCPRAPSTSKYYRLFYDSTGMPLRWEEYMEEIFVALRENPVGELWKALWRRQSGGSKTVTVAPAPRMSRKECGTSPSYE
ncbi:hypothetical protein JVU11DRAFT_6574 [Chiua virens]|nr:hypothetical protein JVU11DRAFT_6574 [Chiua virens]